MSVSGSDTVYGQSNLVGIRDYLNDVSSPNGDFGDIHSFNIGFDRIFAAAMPRAGAMDVINVVWLGENEAEPKDEVATLGFNAPVEALRMRDWELTGFDFGLDGTKATDDTNPSPRLPGRIAGNRKDRLGLIYGLRAIERDDWWSLYASGDILGTTRVNTVAENHVLGPVLGLVWLRSYNRWTMQLQGMASLGFNYGEIDQSGTNGAIGAELVPGATNQVLFAQPTEFGHESRHDELSPNAEVRAEANYRITENMTFLLTWSGVAVENALEVADRTVVALPDFGLADPGSQRLLVHNFFCGVELLR